MSMTMMNGSNIGEVPMEKRQRIRLERLDVDGRPVVACYGHGGAGVTLSWGCADEVAEIASAEVLKC